jgi:hypothetical protein
MEDRPYKFSRLQSCLAFCIALSPIATVLFGLYYMRSSWITLLVFHACLCGLPLVFKYAFQNTAVSFT